MDKPKAIHFPLSAEAEQQAEERAQRAHLHLRDAGDSDSGYYCWRGLATRRGSRMTPTEAKETPDLQWSNIYETILNRSSSSFIVPNSDGLQPTGNGLQPRSDGLQRNSKQEEQTRWFRGATLVLNPTDYVQNNSQQHRLIRSI